MWICIIKRRGGFAVERVFERWTQTRRRKKNGQNYEKNAPYFIEQLSRLHIEINSHCVGDANARVNTVENLTRATNLCKCVNGYCTVFCCSSLFLSLRCSRFLYAAQASDCSNPPRRCWAKLRTYTLITHVCPWFCGAARARARESNNYRANPVHNTVAAVRVHTLCTGFHAHSLGGIFLSNCTHKKKTTNHCATLCAYNLQTI